MAVVVACHADASADHLLVDIVARAGQMKAVEAQGGLALEPGTIFVIRPKRTLSVVEGRFVEQSRIEPHNMPLGIDFLFRSLALEQKHFGVGIVLSGTGTDGSLGVEEIKAAGGITFAQDEKTATEAAMPRSALSTGCVDFTLPPRGIADELLNLAKHDQANDSMSLISSPSSDQAVKEVLFYLKGGVGVDFTNYKRTTVLRRIQRRMALLKLETVKEYAQFIQQNPDEVVALYHDMLIKVTSFFRDPEAFDTLKQVVFPTLLKAKLDGDPLRIWVPGCSTGEEVYSIAICLFEYLQSVKSSALVQIFATDLSDSALEKARSGIYVENIVADVSQERLRRYFSKLNQYYQVSKTIRDVCIFAKQNIISDPPFSKIDLISCRNVLIYLEPVLQKRVMPIFHYALRPHGFLLLGNSESIVGATDLFRMEERNHKVYNKNPVASRLPFEFNLHSGGHYEASATKKERPVEATGRNDGEIQREADRILIARYVPGAVIVNFNLEILHFRGQTGHYLEPGAGAASFSLFKMAKDGLFVELRSAIAKARETNLPVRANGLSVKDGALIRTVDVEVIPLRVPLSGELPMLVLFEEPNAQSPAVPQKVEVVAASVDKDFERLRRELTATKEYLQSTIEQMETTNEELKASHEEVLSSNEELQSTNEELQTAKEEIQSTNEELTTLNEQLVNKNGEMAGLNSDLSNLVNSIHLPILILGRDLCIRRFTPTAEKVLGLVPGDQGRPLRNLRLNLDMPDLDAQALDVLENGGVRESEVTDGKGHWYSVRVRPYMTGDSKIDGAMVAFIDISNVRPTLVERELLRAYGDAVVESLAEPALVLSEQLLVISVNRAFAKLANWEPEKIEGTAIDEVRGVPWLPKDLKKRLLETLLKDGKAEGSWQGQPITLGEPSSLRIEAKGIYSQRRKKHFILLTAKEN